MLFKTCYENKYITYEILHCLDDQTINAIDENTKDYQTMFDRLKLYNEIITLDMKKCSDNFVASLPKRLNETSNELNKCMEVVKKEVAKVYIFKLILLMYKKFIVIIIFYLYFAEKL